MVAKLTKEPPKRKTKDGEEMVILSSPLASRSAIKQAMRMKCNTLISLQKKKVLHVKLYETSDFHIKSRLFQLIQCCFATSSACLQII